jgi:hypothetical protein
LGGILLREKRRGVIRIGIGRGLSLIGGGIRMGIRLIGMGIRIGIN